MASSQTTRAIRDLKRAVLGDPSDARLLGEFVERRDADAFAVLVRRHGPMVWGVCRRMLGDHHDAEDAFQATFLVLARKAASVTPRDRLPNWLHGVAHHVALKARAVSGKRRLRERPMSGSPEPAAPDTPPELESVLDLELARLPELYRTPVVLCELEGLTHKEAASRLGVPEGTLSSRLSRARAMLAGRLKRHGVTVPAGALALTFERARSSAAVPDSLMEGASRVAHDGGTSTHASALGEGVIKAMFLKKLRVGVVCLMAVGLAGVGVIQGLRPGTAVGEPTVELPLAPGRANEGWREREVRKEHGGLVHCVRFAPDGKTFATASADGTIRIWDADTLAVVRTLTASDRPVFCLAYSADGKAVVKIPGQIKRPRAPR